MVQQNLYNPDVTVSGCAVQRRQLILEEKALLVNHLMAHHIMLE